MKVPMPRSSRTKKTLPEELIVEILLRLPVKSLLLFRCVSKRWLSLISDPQFAKAHFKRASERICPTHRGRSVEFTLACYTGVTQRLLLSTPSRLGSLEVDAPFGNGSAARELVFPFKQPGHPVRILGSCNGLVCVAPSLNNFYIWNPSTGDHRKLPNPPGILHGYEEDPIYIHGFGYDSSTDDYKLLMANCFKMDMSETEVTIFSLKRNAWKIIRDLDYPYDHITYSLQSGGAFSNGALHWPVPVTLPQYHHIILAFDLADEKFLPLPLPVMYGLEEEIFIILWVTGGRLCVTSFVGTFAETWAMMEYGEQNSWAPMVRFEQYALDSYDLTPLCFSRVGQLVARNNGSELIKCVHEGKKAKLKVKNRIVSPMKVLERFVVYSDERWWEAAVFVESLLSPNDYGGDDGQ